MFSADVAHLSFLLPLTNQLTFSSAIETDTFIEPDQRLTVRSDFGHWDFGAKRRNPNGQSRAERAEREPDPTRSWAIPLDQAVAGENN